jgi:hypothetical protein
MILSLESTTSRLISLEIPVHLAGQSLKAFQMANFGVAKYDYCLSLMCIWVRGLKIH